MPFLDVYIGNLSDPSFHRDGGNWSGNVPTPLSLFFPQGHTDRSVLVESTAIAGVFGSRPKSCQYERALASRLFLPFLFALCKGVLENLE
jgi:hypothetical protein